MKQNKPQIDEHGILTDEVRHQITHSFYSKYEGRGMSPAEIMQVHGEEFWQEILKAQHQATLYHLAQVTDEELLLTDVSIKGVKFSCEPTQSKCPKGKYFFDTRTSDCYYCVCNAIAKAQLAKVLPIFAAREAKAVEQACIEERKRIGKWLNEPCPHAAGGYSGGNNRLHRECPRCIDALQHGDVIGSLQSSQERTNLHEYGSPKGLPKGWRGQVMKSSPQEK